ncbi:hypothetical protein [Chryseoglobus sp. 28M-23]|jgi:uncharacterized membrane protein HdeD (DUF308 family)|uniref:hypothetical protein n=1 Tax=Chryseoglobus sp. 28M-23 TaxID=2772253 RepID=UPI0017464FF3|nr:hypothetical protein [Chryseoglobus sp. 28M-23]QOD93660.1 hypothetical protein IE160_12320 [Chryseoglobus sp. 28M-23]
MTTAPSADVSAAPRSPWLAPVLRAVPALIVGLSITFIADHSALVGLIMLGAFGLATAAVLALTDVRMRRGEPLKLLHRGLAVITGVAGLLALVVVSTTTTAGLGMLVLLIGGFAVLAGGLELVWGIRHRDRSALARDAVLIGGGTLALAVVLAFVGDPVSAVGFFGAYAVVLGVFLVISGLSARWTAQPKEHTAS